MTKFRKKPVVVDAVQWTGDNIKVIRKFMSNNAKGFTEFPGDKLLIGTLEGNITASKGDWIIRGVQGEYYPCKPDIFEQTYEII